MTKMLLVIMIFLILLNNNFKCENNYMERMIYQNLIDEIFLNLNTDTLIIINKTIILNPVNSENYFDSLLISNIHPEFRISFEKNKNLNLMIDTTILSNFNNTIWIYKHDFENIFNNEELKFHEKWNLFYSKYSQDLNLVSLSRPFYNSDSSRVAIFVSVMNFGYGSGTFYYYQISNEKLILKRKQIVFKS